jgi:hypothetical protein
MTLAAISSGVILRTASVILISVGRPLCPTVTLTAPFATDSVMEICPTLACICW